MGREEIDEKRLGKLREMLDEGISLETYQNMVKETAIYPKQVGLLLLVAGLTEEAGEVAGKIKKLYRDHSIEVDGRLILSVDTSVFIPALKKELGDVLWYATEIANNFNISLHDIIQTNFEKIIKRRETNTLHGSGDNRENE